LSSVQPSIDFIVPAKDLHRRTELEDIANEMYAYFMERFLPNYYTDSN
jgi:hypothetical protein